MIICIKLHVIPACSEGNSAFEAPQIQAASSLTYAVSDSERDQGRANTQLSASPISSCTSHSNLKYDCINGASEAAFGWPCAMRI